MLKPRIQMPTMNLYAMCLFTVIAVLLAVIAFRPLASPVVASAESNYGHLYIEPSTTMLRKPDGTQQVEGKVVIDMRNGNVWGFPTLSSAPYPVDTINSEPPVSTPMYLGKFDFSKMTAK
ncbi:MAG: hypothetical protein WBY44_37290 [Bryobacteraceae bacterium]|jgi:hypothetical protein